jgi:hypothetical protein
MMMMAGRAEGGAGPEADPHLSALASTGAWEKQVLSTRGFERVGRCSEYAI